MRSDAVKKGIEKAPHRSLFRAMGYTDEELSRPLVGIANPASEVIPGHAHLDLITEAVKAGVRMSGGTPIEFGVIGVCDGIAMGHEGMKYSLASRELVADSVESMAMAHAFDALVLIPNCDKIVPGMLMAAARVNIPAVVVSGGPMMAGTLDGTRIDLNTVFEGVGSVAAGTMTEEQLRRIEDSACPGCGSCAGMFTANSMNCLVEVLGMGLFYNGTRACGLGAAPPTGQGSGRGCDESALCRHHAERRDGRGRVYQRTDARHGAGMLDQHSPPPRSHRS